MSSPVLSLPLVVDVLVTAVVYGDGLSPICCDVSHNVYCNTSPLCPWEYTIFGAVSIAKVGGL
jgi:hypothetical protein